MSNLKALLIGNANYTQTEALKNPIHDATDLAKELTARGFETEIRIDLTYAEMGISIETFAKKLMPGDVALVFFAGHAVQIDNRNYLTCIDTPSFDETNAKWRSFPLDHLIDLLEGAKTSTAIIILDACRDNPFGGSYRSVGAGLAPVFAPKGALIAFSTSPGQKAKDGIGKNGAYTAALLKHIGTADLTIEAMFKRVRNTLYVATGGKQTSWEHTSLVGEFFFNQGITRRIVEYGVVALRDGIFVPDTAVWAQGLARGLKSHDYSTQNAAIARFKPAEAEAASTDDLFVLGRNILQAADGDAWAAKEFLRGFMGRTTGMSAAKRKAVLDGILFEIFFDSKGEIRAEPKDDCFNTVFDLQAFSELSTSFAFLSAALMAHANRFHVIPGKEIEISVDVVLTSPKNHVDQVVYASHDILRIDDPDYEGQPRLYRTLGRSEFEAELSRQMLAPRSRLTIHYEPLLAEGTQVRYPYGHTSRRGIDRT